MMEAKEKEANNLRRARAKRGLTQDEVARAIGVSRPTYVNIEAGKKELTVSQVEELDRRFGISFNEIIGIVEDDVQETIDEIEKYKQIVMNAIKYGGDTRDGKITKTKLAKLVYLVDFLWFYEHTESMSGMVYRKLPRGPVADKYFRVLDELEEDGLILRETHGRATMFSLIEERAPVSRLQDTEVDMIRRVGEGWKDRSTDDIVDFSHQQVPWKICFDGEEIPYGYIFQEEPEAIYGPVQRV